MELQISALLSCDAMNAMWRGCGEWSWTDHRQTPHPPPMLKTKFLFFCWNLRTKFQNFKTGGGFLQLRAYVWTFTAHNSSVHNRSYMKLWCIMPFNDPIRAADELRNFNLMGLGRSYPIYSSNKFSYLWIVIKTSWRKEEQYYLFNPSSLITKSVTVFSFNEAKEMKGKER